MAGVDTDLGAAAAAVAPLRAGSVADCDAALGLLRRLSRSGTVEERRLAWRSVDRVLDRRIVLVRR